jgi:hypothetical protein
MKFDKFIFDYLNQNKQITLAGIGTISYDAQLQDITSESDGLNKENNNLTFIYDALLSTSEGFIIFITENIKRPRNVVIADFEDYLHQLISLINIGTSVEIESIGVFRKINKSGKIVFSSLDNFKEKVTYNDYESVKYLPTRKDFYFLYNKLQSLLFSIFGILIICLFFWLVLEKKEIILNSINQNKGQQTEVDLNLNKSVEDTIRTIPSSNSVINDSLPSFRFVFYTTKHKFKADLKMNEYASEPKILCDSLVIQDTLRYRLFVIKKVVPVELSKYKSAFQNYFKRNISIEKLP